jgi:anti-anti-sigma factor
VVELMIQIREEPPMGHFDQSEGEAEAAAGDLMISDPSQRAAPARPVGTGPRFSVASRRRPGEVVVEVRGEVDGCTAPRIEAGLSDVIDDQGHLDVVLDMEAMTFIDSAGLVVNAEALSQLRRKGGTLCLRSPRGLGAEAAPPCRPRRSRHRATVVPAPTGREARGVSPRSFSP